MTLTSTSRLLGLLSELTGALSVPVSVKVIHTTTRTSHHERLAVSGAGYGTNLSVPVSVKLRIGVDEHDRWHASTL
jgi:tRNA-dihydrouridine synthase